MARRNRRAAVFTSNCVHCDAMCRNARAMMHVRGVVAFLSLEAATRRAAMLSCVFCVTMMKVMRRVMRGRARWVGGGSAVVGRWWARCEWQGG